MATETSLPPDADFDGGDSQIDDILDEVVATDALRQELEESKDRYLRLMAEFDNYKRRSSKEFERLIESANEKLMLDFIDVRENFERAIKVTGAGESQAGVEKTVADVSAVVDGMKLIFNKFDDVLKRNGLTAFAEVGEQFDPMIHDALMNSPNENIPAEHIAEVFEHGYRLKDKVIKHARVVVSSGKSE